MLEVVKSKLSSRLGSIMLTCLLIASPSAYATFTDITGAWVGNVTGSTFSCPIPADDGPINARLTVVFRNQNLVSGTFDVSVSALDLDDGTVNSGTGNGGFVSATALSFGFNLIDGTSIDNITVNPATLSGNTISFSFSGSNTGGDNCLFSGSGSITRTSANVVIDPQETPGSTVTEAVLFNTQVQGTVSDISGHIVGALAGAGRVGRPRVADNKFILEGSTGLNAGDGFAIPYGVWGNYSYTDFENDFTATAFDGRSHSLLGGIDFGIWDNTVLGVAFGYDNGDIDTNFNAGHQDTDTYTIAPYFGAVLSDTFSVDATFGFSRVKYDQFRTAGATRISSSPESDRYFAAMNLNGVMYYNNWIIGGRTGIMWARNKLETYTESNGFVVGKSTSKVGTWTVGGDVAYDMKNNYEPFVGLSYNRDYSLTKIAVLGAGPQPANDRDDFLLRMGVRYFNTDNLSGNLEYTTRISRQNVSEDRISMTLRADF